MAEYRDEQAIWVARVDDDRADLLPVAQAEVLPGFPGIGRFVHAVTGGQIGTLQAFAATDVDDVGIGWGHRESAYRTGRLIIEDRFPCMTEIVGFPHAAVVDADVKDVWLTGYPGCSDGSTPSMWSDHPPTKVLIEVGVESLCCGYACDQYQARNE